MSCCILLFFTILIAYLANKILSFYFDEIIINDKIYSSTIRWYENLLYKLLAYIFFPIIFTIIFYKFNGFTVNFFIFTYLTFTMYITSFTDLMTENVFELPLYIGIIFSLILQFFFTNISINDFITTITIISMILLSFKILTSPKFYLKILYPLINFFRSLFKKSPLDPPDPSDGIIGVIDIVAFIYILIVFDYDNFMLILFNSTLISFLFYKIASVKDRVINLFPFISLGILLNSLDLNLKTILSIFMNF